MKLPEYVTINAIGYASAKLSDQTMTQLASVQATDAEISRLQQYFTFTQAWHSRILLSDVT